MGKPYCNTTLETLHIDEIPSIGNLTFHQVALIVSGSFTLIAFILSGFLIFQHATHYSKPWEQKQIIRIIFTVPVYGSVAMASVGFYRAFAYFQFIGRAYACISIVSFFFLICHFIAPDLQRQQEHFKELQVDNWIFPLNIFTFCFGDRARLRKPKSGLTMFNIILFSIMQYVIVGILCELIGLITQAAGLYCVESNGTGFSKLWLTIVGAISLAVCMHLLLQFYFWVRQDYKKHRLELKFLCIKLVIFVTNFQQIIFTLLGPSVLRPSPQINYSDWNTTLLYMILAIEMAIFAIMHTFAYSARPYHSSDPELPYKGHRFGWWALVDAMNILDLVSAIGRSFKFMFVDWKHRNNHLTSKALVYGDTDYHGAGNGAENVGLVEMVDPSKPQFMLRTYATEGHSYVPRGYS